MKPTYEQLLRPRLVRLVMLIQSGVNEVSVSMCAATR